MVRKRTAQIEIIAKDQWQFMCDYLIACGFPMESVKEVDKLGVEFMEAGAPQPKRWAALMRCTEWDRLHVEIIFGNDVTVTFDPGTKNYRRSLTLTRKIKTTIDGTRGETVSQISDSLCAQLVKVFCSESAS